MPMKKIEFAPDAPYSARKRSFYKPIDGINDDIDPRDSLFNDGFINGYAEALAICSRQAMRLFEPIQDDDGTWCIRSREEIHGKMIELWEKYTSEFVYTMINEKD